MGDEIANRPKASVLDWPTILGCVGVASYRVTITLASGCVEAVPPFSTTPFSETALAMGTAQTAVSINAIVANTRGDILTIHTFFGKRSIQAFPVAAAESTTLTVSEEAFQLSAD